MVLRWSQILPVVYFTNIACCGIIKNSEENIMNIFNVPEISRTSDICPEENSNVPVFLEHSDDCGKFYICDSGTPYLKFCQQGLYFNPKINSCDYPRNVRCDKKTTPKGNGRIAEEKKDFCPPENPELPVHLAHPDDCQKFYICDNGTPYLKSCQPGLHFNPRVKACDYPKNAACDKNQGVSEKGRIVGKVFDSCPLENSVEPAYLVHDSDCGKFYVCDNGEAQLRLCATGLHFNPKTNACDYPRNAGCDKNTGINGKSKFAEDEFRSCPLENSDVLVHFRHPSDCGKFYICDNGKPYLKSCPPGLHFNAKINACDYPKNAECIRSVDVKGKDGISGNELDIYCPLENLNDPVYLTHPKDCGKFYVCDNRTPHLESCPVGLHFNPKVNACDYPRNAECDKVLLGAAVRSVEKQPDDLLDNSCSFETNGRPLFIPHSTECDEFFICEGGKKFPFTCPSGLYFNPKQEVCDFPENTDCEKRKFMRAGVSSPFCPPMDGKSPVFFRHSSNCSVFYMCGNGLAYEFSCPARLHFNLRKKVCDYEINAKCKVTGS